MIDPKLSWKAHVTELCKKLSRAVGMLYKIRNICTEPVLISLYYSLFNSHLSYGIALWGVANYTLLQKVYLLQKRAIRAITRSEYLAHTDPLFTKLKILKMNDIYLTNIASLMWDYDHDLIPQSLKVWFNKTSHKYKTRFVTKGKLSPSDVKTTKFGIRSFKHHGTHILNQLKDLDLYNTSKTKGSFMKKLKIELLNYDQ